jgi:hypothetical protein
MHRFQKTIGVSPASLLYASRRSFAHERALAAKDLG